MVQGFSPGAIMICQRCSETVARKSNCQKMCVDCSRVQKFEGIKDRKRRIRARMREERGLILYKKNCVCCEKEYLAKAINSKHCEVCLPVKIKESNKERQKKHRQNPENLKREKRWRQSEKGRVSLRNAKNKLRSTPRGKIESSIRNGIWRTIKLGSKNGRSSFALLEYDIDDLKNHLEKQFQTGMTWENFGQWHIDHKIPLSVFNYTTPDDLDFKRAWALSNLQPLWAQDNLVKHTRLFEPFQPSFAWS